MRGLLVGIAASALIALIAFSVAPFDGAFYINVARVRLADGSERNVTPSQIWSVCGQQQCAVVALYDQSNASEAGRWGLRAVHGISSIIFASTAKDLHQPDPAWQPKVEFVNFPTGWHPVIRFDGQTFLRASLD